ncbi:uncharacterized protein DFL_004603 [Arthrobotrys flagrans]|uniref:Uncharacterized protein n=1 Tax=Arthrobotrys flagrans TaxID=97331 RepID=A0A437A515_ARTFL|nr:hypothetical protein DFL_004603 [Arthrobotrys flagrans]
MRFPYSLPLFLLHLLTISSTPVASLSLNPLPFLKRAFNFSYLPYTLVAVGKDGYPTTLTVSFTIIIYRDQPSTTSRKTTSKKVSSTEGTTKPTGTSTTKREGFVQTVTKRKTVTKYRTNTVTERLARTQTVTKYVTRVSTVKEIQTVTETVYAGWFEDVETVVVTEWGK